MDIHLNHNLGPIFKETSSLVVKSPILNRTFNKSRHEDSLLFEWMSKYCKVFHQLVNEFDHTKIKITINEDLKKKTKKKNDYKNTNLESLLKKLYSVYPDINKEFKFDIFVLNELKKSVLKPIGVSTNALSDWFNNYNQLIYESDNSLLDTLKKYIKLQRINPDLKNLLNGIIYHLEGCNKFMSFNIHEELKKGLKYTYQYTDEKLNFKVHSFKKINTTLPYWRFLYARMKSIYMLYVNNDNKNTQHHQQISFDIYLSNELKNLPNKGGFFGPREINSGCTDYHNIIIWRKEEHMKLILHESIHFYNLDGSLDLSSQNDKINLECHFQIGDHNETRIYEAYTESLAVFINSFANSYQIYYLNPKNKHLRTKTKTKTKTFTELTNSDIDNINTIRCYLWNLERKFALIQISKIFLHFNPKSNDFNDFLINSKNNKDTCKDERSRMIYKLEQKTSVLSYHILKGANIFFDLEFIKWLPDIFNPHPKSLFNFFNYIVTRTHNDEFIKAVNQTIKYLNLKLFGDYSKNLRMTFYESELNI